MRAYLDAEGGALSIVTITAALTLCLSALGAADLGSMLHARARAQAAADAAALAAAARLAPILQQSGSPADAAREEAEANGARLVSCACDRADTGVVVEVAVTPRIAFVTPWVGRDARATARADVDADVMSYRDTG